MKKTILLLVAVVFPIFLFAARADAGINFKMTADKTTLILGGNPDDAVAIITLWAEADIPEATEKNGINVWGLSLFASGDGMVQVVENSVLFLAPDPYSATDTSIGILNAPFGNITDMKAFPQDFNGQDADTGIGGYSEIVQFQIRAVSEGQVTYQIGEVTEFMAILRDGQYGTGIFDAAMSDNLFTIVPEPATLMFCGLGVILLRARKR